MIAGGRIQYTDSMGCGLSQYSTKRTKSYFVAVIDLEQGLFIIPL